MVLIVGGEGSGKRSFVKSLGYTQADLADGVLVFQNPDGIDSLLPELEGKAAVLCNEVGSGVIPVDRDERLGREAVGRLCIQLAQRAGCVVRMVCGIPTVIKGQLP